ncbi:MAG: hypothetical protein OXF49_01410 [Candidatus Saccharibacteria bacterium]|nr:hypothetical protein [Candidatus Saccharibacteria bacterium]
MRDQDIPAEVLNKEDRIVGFISPKQAGLLILPVIVGLLLIFLPPTFSWHAYKSLIVFELGFICCLLAIRIQKRLLYQWLVIMFKFYRRPKQYIRK